MGWSISDHMRTSLVADAIAMTVVARGGRLHGVVFHPDAFQRSKLMRDSGLR